MSKSFSGHGPAEITGATTQACRLRVKPDQGSRAVSPLPCRSAHVWASTVSPPQRHNPYQRLSGNTEFLGALTIQDQ